jgi:hypothetical protein
LSGEFVSEKHDFDEEKYFRIWARQLLGEFESLCYDCKVDLDVPVFEITHNRRMMGAWLADSRTIQISSYLILDHAWPVVLNVLKHEMAHQVCSDLLGIENAGHGSEFKRACAMLGVPPEYSGAAGDLPDNIAVSENGGVLTTKGRKFIDKVEKLLALAKSDNENEAALAMQKANDLISKHNISLLSVGEKSQYTYVVINSGKQKLHRHQRRICEILRSFFYVQVVYSFLYDPMLDRDHKTIELLGTPENVTIAEYCYHFLENQLASLWRQNKGQYKGNALRAKNSYYLGALNGFYRKLREQKESNANVPKKSMPATTKALEVQNLLEVENRRLKDYVACRFPRLRVHRSVAATVYADSFQAGVQAGKEINLHKGVASHDGNQGHLISP